MVESVTENEFPADKENDAVGMARELTRLHKETAEARAILARLQEGVANAENWLSSSQATLLMEANQKLVATMLSQRAETEVAIANSDALPVASPLLENALRTAQLAEANAHLVVAAIDAQALQTAAESAMAKQTDFLAVLAHELRNPLAPLSNAAALVGLAGPKDLPQVQAIIERQVGHLSRLVSDLLDVSRVNTGKLRLELSVVDMKELLLLTVDACRPAIDSRTQKLSVEVPAVELKMTGDPVRLTQIFSNLLDNASKYTPNKGRIGLCAAVSNDSLVVSITDTGIGIREEALSNVFDPFVQDPHALGFNNVGLGIGLAVVRELVESHGGSVFARSGGGGLGSEFVVTLPLMAT